MKEKVKWYCPRCKRYVENPSTGRITIVGLTGQMGCDVCGSWLMKIKEDEK